jgi:membrane-associated phospholipid phosphatase
VTFDSFEGSTAVEYRERTASRVITLVHMFRPTEADFAKQLEFVRNYAALRLDRSSEIMAQIGDIISFLAMVHGLRPARHVHTLELLGVALHATFVIEMRMKHALACRRPDEYSPQIQAMIVTPGHGTLPSGHATEAFVAAFLLDSLSRASRDPGGVPGPVDTGSRSFVQLMRIAERIAINRTVAGVHFPADSAAGFVLARTLGEFFLAKFSGAGPVSARSFDGRGFASDFDYETFWTLADESAVPGKKICKSDEPVPVARSPLLNHLWLQAVAEWKTIG